MKLYYCSTEGCDYSLCE